jgi:hypothetical protein
MTSSIRHDFHADLASVVSTDIQYQRSNYYYFLGKVETWGVGDSAPTLPELDSDAENVRIRSNALFAKKIAPSDVSLVSTRYDWVSGTVFSVWDHTKNMRSEKFYCVTADGGVYKCLDNNGGAQSTIAPSGNSLTVTTTADGYTWKYMYSIQSFKRAKFMSGSFIPVQKALSDSFYNRGAVNSVSVVDGGSGYSSDNVVEVVITGGTTGAGAAATVIADINGTITSVSLSAGGSGYTHGVRLVVNTTSGAGAILTPVIVGGVIDSVTVTNGGIGYVTTEPILFNVGGAVAIPAIAADGSIQDIKITDAGIGYNSNPTVAIVSPTTGTGQYGNPTATALAIVSGGSLARIAITDPGINYPREGATTIVVSGDGTGAVFYPVIYNGTIVSVLVSSPGDGYSIMQLSVVGTGSGAKLTPIMYGSDYASNQSIVEQVSVVGAIYSIQVKNGGNNYSSATTIVVGGDGTGCTATPVISGGVITKIIVNNYGSGYTYTNITIADPNRTLIGTVVDAELYCVLPPTRGHGYDAVSELFGETLVINSSLRQEVLLNSLSQDYRQFGILKDPSNVLTGKLFTESSSLIAYVAQFDTVAGITIDEILILGGVRFRVVSVSGVMVTLQPLGTKFISPLGLLVAEAQGTRSYNSFKIISSPSVNKYSGKLLYVSDEAPFSFSEDQGIVIKTFLKF